MSYLSWNYGTMGSSKTANLLMSAKTYDLQNKKVLVYRSPLDKGWNNLKIISRSGVESRDCLVFPDGKEIISEIQKKIERENIYYKTVKKASLIIMGGGGCQQFVENILERISLENKRGMPYEKYIKKRKRRYVFGYYGHI